MQQQRINSIDQLDIPSARSLSWLRILVKLFRKQKDREALNTLLLELIQRVKDDIAFRSALGSYINGILQSRNHSVLYAEVGIFQSIGFFSEIRRKISHSILPPLPDRNSLELIFHEVFNSGNDHQWLADLDDTLLGEFFNALEWKPVNQLEKNNFFCREIEEALLIVSQRLSAIGIDREILEKAEHSQRYETPYLEQNRLINQFIGERNLGTSSKLETITTALSEALTSCEASIKNIRDRKSEVGTSLGLTFKMLRIQQHIDRIKTLNNLLNAGKSMKWLAEIHFFKELVRLENKKNSFRDYFYQTTELLAYQITEHTAKAGEHLITNNRKEYREMLRSALGAGFVVSFFCFGKIIISFLHMAPFWEALWFGINYSAAFLIVHFLHFTIATKQPAMTASALAHSLDKKGEGIHNLAELIVKIFRSQFAAFVGNLLLVFPLPLLIAFCLDYFGGSPIVDSTKAAKMLKDIHPFQSLSLFYAAIAGLCLFLSGLISGYYDNKNVYAHISKRLRRHPVLRKLLGPKLCVRLSIYLNHNIGKLAGNISLGMFLGFAGMLGFIFALPIDIRHITFSTGNFAIALEALNFEVPWQTVVCCTLGCIGIGFFNFSFSFGLATALAIKSRGITFEHTGELFRHLLNHLKRHPLDFLIPPPDHAARKMEVLSVQE